MNIAKKLAAAASAGLFLASAVPALAIDGGGAVISGNGYDSTNTIKISTSCTTVVNQQNYSSVGTSVSVAQNTGGNTASFNTGGDNSITTGDTVADITVGVGGNTNEAGVESCCCESGSTSATIEGNGSFSTNKIWDMSSSTMVQNQQNKKKVRTRISARQNTGKNHTDFNTDGSNSIGAGGSSATVTVGVEGDTNFL